MKPCVLITGAGGGMGSATCRLLLEKGYRVLALDRRAPEVEGDLTFLATDLTDPASVEAAFEKVSAATDELAGIIHMAGIYDLKSLIEMGEEDFGRIFQVNLFGVYRVNRIFYPLLKKNSRVIITTSELAPLDPLPFTGIYGVTKAALEKYAYSLRMELNLKGMKVSVIRPGAVKTDLLGVSTTALERFCKKTKLYPCNADRFRNIVNHVEAKSVAPEKIAALAAKALEKKHPRYTYSINRNPLLRLLNLMPQHFQVWIIRQILKEK